ncbi:MAG: hypothetical protein CL596_01070 [Alteromonas sp.]|nr:hypothetical protein [Alteromonas sp.]MAY22583.1 hypothetical protein [Flavobacteriaceae bacterium]
MKKVVYILVLVILASCQHVDRPEKPENLIPKDQMVQILAEAYTGNAARSISNRTLREEGLQIDSLIYNKYRIDSLQFVESNDYYASEINDYIAIMEEVKAVLEARKVTVDTLLAQEKRLQKKTEDTVQTLKDEAPKDTLEPKTIAPVQE